MLVEIPYHADAGAGDLGEFADLDLFFVCIHCVDWTPDISVRVNRQMGLCVVR